MKSVRLLLRVVCVLLCAVCCISMARGISTADFGYYEEDLINPLKDRDVGGTDALTMQNADGRYTLETQMFALFSRRKRCCLPMC